MFFLPALIAGALLAPGFDAGADLTASISARSLRGHLSFIASDNLEGRGTPSRGLDLAAEYIAAQFERCGLAPAGDDGYFQTASIQKGGVAVPVRNVIGVLKGSDPALADSYILVTAHYDHLGMKSSGEGHRIYNGANDDGSGTVSVLELAEAFSRLKERPKRSLVFMTFYGEELGLVGSNYYGAHPIFPALKTVADVNIEQVGRTDDTEGQRVSEASMTGFDFSNLGAIFATAGQKVGVAVTKHPKFSDIYFAFSDNQAMADRGVPSCTLCTAYEFPGYHSVTDTIEKIDFENMAKIDRMIALGVLAIANDAKAPKWSDNPKAAKYKKLREGGAR